VGHAMGRGLLLCGQWFLWVHTAGVAALLQMRSAREQPLNVTEAVVYLSWVPQHSRRV
jgi:hypothetical protein